MNMKKSIERFKVRIDQNLNRSEKSVALTPDLLKIEETIGVYKQVCSTLKKNFSEGLQGFGKGTDGPSVDRRLKKTSDFLLGQSMLEVGRTLIKQNSLSCLAQVLEEIGGLCNGLALNQVHYEIFVEQMIVGKLQEVLSTDLPSILGGRKQLDRLILELDTAKARLDKAREEEQHGTPGAASRIERCVEDLDDTARKVEQARDTLAADMLMFLARDNELAGLVASYLEFRLNLHLDNISQLELIKPRIEGVRSTRRGFPIFGTSLKHHLESFGVESGVAYPIQLCVTKLVELGLEEEGLFRLAAGSSKVKRLRAELEAGHATLTSLEGCDHHILTAIMKTYLRELPSPLLGEHLYQDWLEAGSLQGEDRFDAIWNLLQNLPRENYRNVHYLFRFLHEVSLHSEKNKMSASNLAIVITPNVIWSTEAVQDVMDVGVGGVLAQVVEIIILQHNWFFQNDPSVVWNEKLTPLGTCIPAPTEDFESLSMSAGIADALHNSVTIASSPLTASREKNKKNKKAPAPPPTNSPNGFVNPGFNGNITPGTTAAPFTYPGTSAAATGAGAPPRTPSGSNSPVLLRNGSPGKSRTSESLVHRSKSVEGRGILQHPSQPPPKPPTSRHSGDTPSKVRASTDANSKTRASLDTPRESDRTPSKSRESENTPTRSRESTKTPSASSTRDVFLSRDPDASNSSSESLTPGGVPPGSVEVVYSVVSTPQCPVVHTVHTGSTLYPTLSEEDFGSDHSNTDAERQFPVPAPRYSKPALPSKPEGLSRNMSVRTSGGGGAEQRCREERKDNTKL